MKKLLLVMLVPVMVLGIMGCGKSLETGGELPYILHGTWVADPDQPYFVFAANQMTIFVPFADGVSQADLVYTDGFLQLAFQAEFGGLQSADFATGDDDDRTFTVTITRILDGIEWGTFEMYYDNDDDTIIVVEDGGLVVDTSVLPFYEFSSLLPEDVEFGRAILAP
jgi:hypothetical protein